MTERQQEVLERINEIVRIGIDPSVRQLARSMRISTSSTFKHITLLRKRGLIRGLFRQFRIA